MSTGALVVAGGRGERLGEPKALLVVGGTTLVERAVAIARAAGCDPVRVVTRRELALPTMPAVDVVVDPPGEAGPLAAIAQGLASFDDGADVLVFACDLPNALPVVRRLLAFPDGVAVVAVDPDGRDQPLCARYPVAATVAAATAALAAGDRRVRALIDALAPDRAPAEFEELLNVNSRADLEKVRPAINS